MPQTKLIHLTDSYKQTHQAKITSISTKGSTTSATLNQTIFYPQGGGQPSDKGAIVAKTGTLQVTHVSYNNGQPLHQGKLKGKLKKGQAVELTIDWDHRFFLMRAHSAGHILHEAVQELTPEYAAVQGVHGIGGNYYVKYKGVIDQTYQDKIQTLTNQIISSDESFTTKFMSRGEMDKAGIPIPENLPTNKPLRIARVGDRLPVPDGGTQVSSSSKVGPIQVTDITYENGHSLVHYKISDSHPRKRTLAKTKPSNQPLDPLSLSEFKKKLQDTKKQFEPDQKRLTPEKLTTKYLGKRSGKVGALTSLIPQLNQKNRGVAGHLINQLKQEISSSTDKSSGHSQASTAAWLDVTVPGQIPPLGHLHPISQAIDEITQIFTSIGFTRVRYPEVDWDYYVFESLNMPKGHPARDEWETFFVDTPDHQKLGKLVLTTHTSNGQVREMERLGKPPIRMINIAKCYRRQQDVTHTAMFHQFEGLVVDRGINIGHLKGTIDYFAKHFYGKGAKSRIRPFHFQFTEPSFEVDFSCTICAGKGCKFCKSGWHEVGGAGMVHPNVLRAGGIDPDRYTGFAFGWGVERTYTLKPGLELDDIRLLYANKLDFLQQF